MATTVQKGFFSSILFPSLVFFLVIFLFSVGKNNAIAQYVCTPGDWSFSGAGSCGPCGCGEEQGDWYVCNGSGTGWDFDAPGCGSGGACNFLCGGCINGDTQFVGVGSCGPCGCGEQQGEFQECQGGTWVTLYPTCGSGSACDSKCGAPYCGDTFCWPGGGGYVEDCSSCPQDCGGPCAGWDDCGSIGSCLDGSDVHRICSPFCGADPSICYDTPDCAENDCNALGGNGYCAGLGADCGFDPPLGCEQAVCGGGGNCYSECSSCPAPPTCPDATCQAGETCSNCPADCGSCPVSGCPNNFCDNGENCSTCPQDCGDCEPPPPPPPPPPSVLQGRIFKDDNGNASRDAGEQFIQWNVSCAGGYTLPVVINYSGASSGADIPDLCNPDPYYNTGFVPNGNYTVSVSPPAGWVATTGPQNVSVASSTADVWFGVRQASPTCTNTTPGSNQLIGCLWDGTNYNVSDGNAPSGPVLSTPVPDSATALDQNWGTGEPNSFVGVDQFSSRWQGNFYFKAGGVYTFTPGSDDGIRAYVDGALQLDRWVDRGYTEDSFNYTFSTAGNHLIQIDYYENAGDARGQLRWTYVPPAVPTNLNNPSLPGCAFGSYVPNFAWTNSGSGWILDVTSDDVTKNPAPLWSTWSNKLISGTSTDGNGLLPAITFVPGTTYYWRIWNVYSHTYGPSFSVPICPPSGTISASPNPCQITSGNSVCTSNITWSSTNALNPQVCVNSGAGDSLFAAGVSGTQAAPWIAAGKNYVFTLYANGCGVQPVANVTVTANPTVPTGLGAVVPVGCQPAGTTYNATFSWSGFNSGWVLDISTDNSLPWSPGAQWWYANIPYPPQTNTITTPTGFSSTTLPNPIALQPGVRYFWRIFNGYTHTYGPSFFVVPACPDLSVTTIELRNSACTSLKGVFGPSESMCVRTTVTNLGGDSGPFSVGFWKSNGSIDPNCPPGAPNPPADSSTSYPGLAAGASVTWQISPNPTASTVESNHTASVYADTGCSITTDPARGNNVNTRLYSVGINSWFETTRGDAGSHGTISVSNSDYLALTSRTQSEFMLVANPLGSNIRSSKWSINNYNKILVPSGGVYSYFYDRFRNKVPAAAPVFCTVPSGLSAVGVPPGNHYYACAGNATFAAGGPNGNHVFFIDGDLNIQGNVTLAIQDTAVYVVRGNINVNTNVTRIDGVFITDGIFTDTDALTTYGARLEVKGAVYARTFNLSRKLNPALITVGLVNDPYNSQYTPTETFSYDPKYIDAMNSILGSAAVTWKEIAP